MDQLEVLMGCGPRTVQRTVARLRAQGLVRAERMIVGEPAWVTPTSAGMAACGVGFGVWRPRIGLLSHVAAVNDVRLHIQGRAPRTEWVPERVLAKERRAGEHLPDGVAITEGRRVAIEVELTVKSRERITAILDELADYLEIHALLHDNPVPFIWMTQHTHPPTELRIDRLRPTPDESSAGTAAAA